MVGRSTLAGLDPFIFGADNRPFTWHHQEYRDSSRMMQENQMQCFEALIFSDVDYNRQVNKTEYITFLNSYGPSDFLSSVETFDDLPL